MLFICDMGSLSKSKLIQKIERIIQMISDISYEREDGF